MKYKFLTRRVTLLIFDDVDSVNYTAACQININGRHGTIDTLVGKGFYNFLAEYGYAPFKELGLVEVSAAMTPAHYRLLSHKLKGIKSIKITEVAEPDPSGDISLFWIRMTEV